MTYGEATEILAANAACQLQNGCGSCPIYIKFIEAGRPQGYCNQYTSYDRVKEAVELIQKVGVLNSISVL